MEITPSAVQGNKQHKQHRSFSVHLIFSPLLHNSKLSKLLKKKPSKIGFDPPHPM